MVHIARNQTFSRYIFLIFSLNIENRSRKWSIKGKIGYSNVQDREIQAKLYQWPSPLSSFILLLCSWSLIYFFPICLEILTTGSLENGTFLLKQSVSIFRATAHALHLTGSFGNKPFSSPEPTILLACGRNREALGATISGMRHRCRLRENGWAEFGYFLCYFKMVAPRASRFLLQARRIVGSGDENGNKQKLGCWVLRIVTFCNISL